MKNWIDNITENEDMVLSSRVRLARNIKGVPFPHKLESEEAKALAKNIEDIF